MKRHKILSVWLGFIFLAACGSVQVLSPTPSAAAELSLPTPLPTYTRAPTRTPLSSPTPSPSSTVLVPPEPTATPNPLGANAFIGPLVINQPGGFALHVPAACKYGQTDNRVEFWLEPNLRQYYLLMDTSLSSTGTVSPEILAQTVSDLLTSVGVKELNLSDPITRRIGSYDFQLQDFTGIFAGVKGAGRSYILPHDNTQVFVGFGFSGGVSDAESWSQKNTQTETLAFGSLVILPAVNEAKCETSTDLTYGSAENPVKVGGYIYGGPSREAAYFESLKGPKGVAFNYKRLGSVEGVDGTLNEYLVTLPTGDRHIFMDIYHYESPKAPAWMECIRLFPFGQLPSLAP